VGGYFVNQVIAERLIYKYAKGDNAKRTNLGKGMDIYRRWRKGEMLDLSMARPDLKNFVRNFHHAIYDQEFRQKNEKGEALTSPSGRFQS
jgi:hypothetical protein